MRSLFAILMALVGYTLFYVGLGKFSTGLTVVPKAAGSGK